MEFFSNQSNLMDIKDVIDCKLVVYPNLQSFA